MLKTNQSIKQKSKYDVNKLREKEWDPYHYMIEEPIGIQKTTKIQSLVTEKQCNF